MVIKTTKNTFIYEKVALIVLNVLFVVTHTYQSKGLSKLW